METRQTATVVKHTGSHYQLSELPKWELFSAVIKGKLRLKGFNSTNPIAVGDIVDTDAKIGVSGTNVKDTNSGIHVHLEILHNGKHINPKDAIGKETSELASVVK